MTIQTVASEPAPRSEEGASTLSLNDLVIVLQIIQASTARGAFKPEELSTVGGLYDKLVAFLESAGALTKAGQETGPSVPAVPNSNEERTNA